MIDFDFQGFINNIYILKPKENGFSILVEADTLEEAQNIAEQKLTELKKHKLEVTEETFK